MTFFHKFLMPLWLGLGLLNLWFFQPRIVDPNTEYLRYVFIVAIGIWFFFLGWSLKRVSIYGDKLYISNFRREIVVPLSEIVDVRGNVFLKPQRVTIYLRNPTEFGTKIKFIAPHRWFSFWSVDPIVDELRTLACSQTTSSSLTPPPLR